MTAGQNAVTKLLLRWNEGDKQALDQLMPLISEELHRIARSYFQREPAGHTLQPTALVNECYLRLIDRQRVSWKDRSHFFAFAASTMRRILVDRARARNAAKRGDGAPVLTLEAAGELAEPVDLDILALEDALVALAELDPRQSRIVELRFFAGLSIRETAETMGLAVVTINRDWASARAWLHWQLRKA